MKLVLAGTEAQDMRQQLLSEDQGDDLASVKTGWQAVLQCLSVLSGQAQQAASCRAHTEAFVYSGEFPLSYALSIATGMSCHTLSVQELTSALPEQPSFLAKTQCGCELLN